MRVTTQWDSADAIVILGMAAERNQQCLERWQQNLDEAMASETETGAEEYITRQIKECARIRDVIRVELSSFCGANQYRRLTEGASH